MKKQKRKKNTITKLDTKRRPVSRFGLRQLHARVSRRQRVAATADHPGDLQGTVPNVGVARALMIILGLHVLAIAGIFVHNQYFDKAGRDGPVTEVEEVKPAPETSAEPKAVAGEFAYVVLSGDSYAKVAEQHGVAEDQLRLANLNVPLRPGRILRIPSESVAASVAPGAAAGGRDGRVAKAGGGQPSAAEAVLVRPAGMGGTPARAAARAQAAGVGEAGTYVVKSGDSVWRIANRFKIDQGILMKANGIDDPRKLKIGMALSIPGSR